MPASFSSTTSDPDRLVVHSDGLVSRKITLLSGEDRSRGAVLGKQTTDTVPTTGTADAGNTGDGTLTGVAAGGVDIQEGTYTVRCFEAATDGGHFEVIAPDGELVGIAVVDVAFTSDHLDLTVNDGATDFAVGDEFTIEVSGSGKYKLSTATATDGSQHPDVILSEDTDASAADVDTTGYEAGVFDENEITLGSGHTADSVREGLRKKGITLVPSTTA